jgi:hypothetical protein
VSTRLELEHESVVETLRRTDHAWLERTSPDLRRHDVVYAVRTIVRDRAGRIREEEREVGVIFELDPEHHPRVPPLVVCRSLDLFHPNIADGRWSPAAVVCMGSFLAQQRLGDWVVGTWDILRWGRLATDHALNAEAAAWARLELGTPDRFPVDRREFARPRRRTPPADAAHPAIRMEPARQRIVSPWRWS